MALFLSNEDIEKILTPRDVINVMRVALRDYGLKNALNSPRSRLPLPEGLFRAMMSTIPSLDVAGLKQGMWLSSEKEGRTKDVERRTELVSLYSISKGSLLAIINSHRLNELRTAAASAVATEYLARKDATTVGIIGTGLHALAHLEALGEVRNIEEYWVYSRNSENRAKFLNAARLFTTAKGIEAGTAHEAVSNADIIVEATYSRTPVLFGEWLRPGVHINSIGSSFAGKQVIDYSVFERVSCYVVDFKEQALFDNSGDIINPISRGIFSYNSIVELGEVVAGVKNGRKDPGDITLYKSLGMGLFDVCGAYAAYKKALELGRGVRLPI
jgi:ornithine cyclodeaminase/alanine dehydrogenase-like protein (mu-crystallin family)